MKLCVCVILVLGTPISICGSQDLAVSVYAEPQVLRAGDQVTFTIRYSNNSNRDLAIIPEGHVYKAADIDLKKESSGEKGTMVPFLTLEYDFTGVAKALRTLKPGQRYERKISATVSLTLPQRLKLDASDKGLYLLFSDSAIVVPGFGAYAVTAEYGITDYFKHFLQEKQRGRLWAGEVKAPPIRLNFEMK